MPCPGQGLLDCAACGSDRAALRPSARPLRILGPGRRLPHPSARRARGGARHAGRRHHRSRLHGRRDRAVPHGRQGRHQTAAGLRDLPRRRPSLPYALEPARLEPPDAAGGDDGRLPQPDQALHARLSRGLLLQAARRLRAARDLRRGHHRALGLPVRPHLHGAAPGRRRPRAGGDRPPGADLRARRRLRRAAGRGHRRAQERQPGPPRAGGRRRPAGGRHRRRPLPARGGRRAARGAALHPDQRPALEPEPLPLLDAGLLPQDARRDEPDDGALGRRRPARPDARDRRALQRRARPRAHPPAALRRGRRRLVRNAAAPVRGGHARALRRGRSAPARPARVRAPDDQRDGLRRLLPDRLGLRTLREGQRRHGRPRPRLGGGLDRRLRAAHHRSRPACATTCCSSAS